MFLLLRIDLKQIDFRKISLKEINLILIDFRWIYQRRNEHRMYLNEFFENPP